MDDRTRREETPTFGAQLTVNDIRGLLIRIGAELARTAGAKGTTPPRDEQARMIPAREFVERMVPFLRMN